ncbi:MAG: hypothetical protein PHU21_09130, partial [Elusimicrobia bacterium]|nr:hypothetical protein [Elusimicrobiota bacterium]
MGDSRRVPYQLLGFLAGAALLLVFAWTLHFGAADANPYPQDDYVFLGDHLLHGFQDQMASWHLPLYGDLRALLNLRALAESDVTRGCLVVVYAVLLASGFLLGGGPCALVTGLGMFGLYHYGNFLEAHDIQQFYSLLVLLTAGLLIWRAQAPSAKTSLLLALALGVSLSCRSTMVFFPPLLVLYEWLAQRRPLREYWRQALILLVVPYLFLLPFIGMNWQLRKEFVPVEYGQCDGNIIPGALGIVGTPEGNFRALADRPLQHSEVLGWAIREVLRHPLRYLAGYARRLALVFSWAPLLFILALFGLWRGRSRAEVLQLAFLALYFPALYCFMSIQAHYFKPLWYLLWLLAAYGLTSWVADGWKGEAGWVSRLARGAVLLILAGLLALSGHAGWVALTYAGRAVPISAAALDAAIREHPRDSCLRYERGLLRLKEGGTSDTAGSGRKEVRPAGTGGTSDTAGFAADFRRAVELSPFESKYRLALALVEGRWQGAPSQCAKDRGDVLFMRAAAELKAGRRAAAREALQAAMAEYAPTVSIHDQRTGEDAFLQRLRSADNEFLMGGYQLLSAVLRPREALALLREMEAVRPGQTAILLEEARLAAQAGERRLALESLARVRRETLDPEGRSTMRGLLVRLGDYRAALALLPGLLKGSPDDARSWLEQAELAWRAGDRKLALDCLARARTGKLDEQGRSRELSLSAALGERGAAPEEPPRPPDASAAALEQANLAWRAGDRKLALECQIGRAACRG